MLCVIRHVHYIKHFIGIKGGVSSGGRELRKRWDEVIDMRMDVEYFGGKLRMTAILPKTCST